ncbi:MAG: L,D-transpeptidase family protein [Verrucomicrobiota bacterium]
MVKRIFLGLVVMVNILWAGDFVLPMDCGQMVVGLAPGWDSSEVILQKWEKVQGEWKEFGKPWKGRVGRNGLAWGRGLHPGVAAQRDEPVKREGDWRAPAGVFSLGSVYGYQQEFPLKTNLGYFQVTERDLWIEDINSPYYNKHVRLKDNVAIGAWARRQQMKQADPAHCLKLFIHHNSGKNTKPGFGSAIFFHIWREDGQNPTAGCTSMSEYDLRFLISWLDAKKKPLFVLLPAPVYKEFRSSWHLP